jgi:hypothetical protein
VESVCGAHPTRPINATQGTRRQPGFQPQTSLVRAKGVRQDCGSQTRGCHCEEAEGRRSNLDAGSLRLFRSSRHAPDGAPRRSCVPARPRTSGDARPTRSARNDMQTMCATILSYTPCQRRDKAGCIRWYWSSDRFLLVSPGEKLVQRCQYGRFRKLWRLNGPRGRKVSIQR